MKHFRVIIALTTFAIAISVFCSSHTRAANEAAEFQPAAAHQNVVLPKQTEITAVILSGIASSSAPRSSITAFVSAPVLFNGNVAIPRGAQLDGRMKILSSDKDAANTELIFDVLTIGSRLLPIQTQPINVVISVRSDTNILIDALKTLVAAGISAGMGASSRDERLLQNTLMEGTKASMSPQSAIPITVILMHDLHI